MKKIVFFFILFTILFVVFAKNSKAIGTSRYDGPLYLVTGNTITYQDGKISKVLSADVKTFKLLKGVDVMATDKNGVYYRGEF